MPERFVQKPVYVEAMQLTSTDDLKPIADWVKLMGGDAVFGATFEGGPANYLEINGTAIAQVARQDWVIRSSTGKWNVMSSSEFDQRFQRPASDNA